MKNHLILLSTTLWFFTYCENRKKPDREALLESMDTLASEETAISHEVISDIIQQIPSPLEISVLIKKGGAAYSEEYLNSPNNAIKYNTNFEQALNLGIYGTDLGYTNIYEKNQDALFYLKSIRDLSEELNIGQFFDFGTITKLATNSKNFDSLLTLTTRNFNDINAYLQEQNRSKVSVLLLAGGWLEALHICCKVYADNPEKLALREKIGEQKLILDNILLLLSFYQENDPKVRDLVNQLKQLKNAYDQIKIKYTYRESSYEIVEGVLIVKDNSTSTININDEHVEQIINVTTGIRSEIIS